MGVANAGALVQNICIIPVLPQTKQGKNPALCVGNRARIDLLLSLYSVLQLINVFKLLTVRGPNF